MIKLSFVIRWAIFGLLCWLVACSPEPEPIVFGEDHCHYCKMGIVDRKFGGELVTDKGKIYKFDAIECLVPFMREQNEDYAMVLVVAYESSGELYPVESLKFAESEDFKSPMGGNIAAFTADGSPSVEKIMDWQEVFQQTE